MPFWLWQIINVLVYNTCVVPTWHHTVAWCGKLIQQVCRGEARDEA